MNEMKCFSTTCEIGASNGVHCYHAGSDCPNFISESEARAGARSVTGRSIGSTAERSEAGNHAETEGKPPFSGERSSPENA